MEPMELEDIMQLTLERLSGDAESCFGALHKALGIKNGDIEPSEAVRLDNAIHNLAEEIIAVAIRQERDEADATSTNESEEKEMQNVKVIETIGEHTLLERYNGEGKFLEYVVALRFNPSDNTWASGSYFTPSHSEDRIDKLKVYSLAVDYLLYAEGAVKESKMMLYEKLNKQTIPYNRLAELATQFKDGIFDAIDCMEQAYDYFEELDMSDEEKEFFNVKRKEYDIYEVECEQVISRKVKVAVPKGSDEEEAVDIAEDIFEGLDYNADMEIEYGSIEASPRFITRCKADDIDDVENDIDEL